MTGRKFLTLHRLESIGVSGAMEAVDSFHFCSALCRMQYKRAPSDQYMEDEEEANVDKEACETCGKQLEDGPVYQVYVGNIGKVYDGPAYFTAKRDFDEYVRQSKADYGRAGGETVTLFKDGDIIEEHETGKEN